MTIGSSIIRAIWVSTRSGLEKASTLNLGGVQTEIEEAIGKLSLVNHHLERANESVNLFLRVDFDNGLIQDLTLRWLILYLQQKEFHSTTSG